MKITSKLRVILENISRRVVVSVLMDISPSNIFLIMLLLERYQQNSQAVLGTLGSINVIRSYDTLENNLFQYMYNHELETYLKESCCLVTVQHFSSKLFLKNVFVKEISPK